MMSKQADERERIQRIRDRQIRARDPGKKERAFQQNASARYHKEELTARSILRDIPTRWTGMFVGAVFGIVVVIVLGRLIGVDTVWCNAAKPIVVIVCTLMGRALGAVIDWRDEEHDAIMRGR
jgi:F0F1-type ATP synthase assembly protein I